MMQNNGASAISLMYCGDANIADGVLVSVLSVMRATTRPLHVYVLTAAFAYTGKKNMPRECYALSESFACELDAVLKAANADSFVFRVDLTDAFVASPPRANMKTRFTPCCMLRLYAPEVPEIPDKVLYLDNDVLCRNSVEELFDTDITNFDVAGTLDRYGRWFFRKNLFRMDYMNSGVLLINMARIRQNGLFRRCRERCATKKMFMPDQSSINKMACKHLLPRRFNEQYKLREDTSFQHFCTRFGIFPRLHLISVKPWHVDAVHERLGLHEYDDVLSEYLRLAPGVCAGPSETTESLRRIS